jgi:hypothetical protein
MVVRVILEKLYKTKFIKLQLYKIDAEFHVLSNDAYRRSLTLKKTQNELTLLLKDSVFNSTSNDVQDSKNLDIGKFEVLFATFL